VLPDLSICRLKKVEKNLIAWAETSVLLNVFNGFEDKSRHFSVSTEKYGGMTYVKER